MKAVRYPSSDGLEIPAYLTLPKGVPAKNLPAIVLPHGGPWARDVWGYSGLPQFSRTAATRCCSRTSAARPATERSS